jgi:dTDP-glucose 4,6-dehydratase
MFTNKKILLTGGTGFFGNSLQFYSGHLKGNEIVIMSRNGRKPDFENTPFLKNNKIRYVASDVRSICLEETDFDFILHAATSSCSAVADKEMESVIIDGTKSILEFAQKNKKLEKLLYVSSGAVYGPKHQYAVTEDDVCEPNNIYGQSKLFAEQLCLESKLPIVIARCFTFIGEYLPLDIHFAIGNFIKDCLEEKDIIITGDGSPVRTYLHSEDLATWLWLILSQGKTGEIYNLGSDKEINLEDLAALVLKAANSDKQIKVLSPKVEGPISYYSPNIDKLKQDLNVEIKVKLEQAISRTLDFHRQRTD